MVMQNTVPITYGEFYDVPRMVSFQLNGNWFFMRSFFDEERDDYADFYDVYLLPFRCEADLRAHPDYWMELDKSIHLGRIAIAEVGLDATRRQTIDAAKIQSWLSVHATEAALPKAHEEFER
jgi:hypothetical protein